MSEQYEITLPVLSDNATLQLADPSLVNFYTDLDHRIYWLNDEITNCTFDLVQYIIKWNREDKDLSINYRKPIRIIIDCPGGHLSVSETVSNIIKMSKTPVYGIALGYVASGASVIYLSCHKRFALENSVFVLHKGGCSGVSGTYDEVVAFVSDYEKQMEMLMNFYITNTNYTKEEIEDNIQTDWYIRTEEALKRGIVDKLITDIDIFY
jgi:ATP-dependent protease ClpP protease subunit